MTLDPLPESMQLALATLRKLALDHHVVMIGHPGVGKTMLARRLARPLPESPRMRWEIGLAWWWAFGGPGYVRHCAENAMHGLPEPGPFVPRIPDGPIFRAPHYTVGTCGLFGGGNPFRPGEVTLAHGGVLFLDELPEFASAVLNDLRYVLDEQSMGRCRRGRFQEVPASFRLVAAMNPCPCGYLGHLHLSCTCPETARARYVARVAPLLCRPDVVVVRLSLRSPLSSMHEGVDVEIVDKAEFSPASTKCSGGGMPRGA